jgi:hypothetical protein
MRAVHLGDARAPAQADPRQIGIEIEDEGTLVAAWFPTTIDGERAAGARVADHETQ